IGNLIAGNSIGTDAKGDLPTQDNGPVVRIVDSPGNTIGGVAGNRIASRNRPAVVVVGATAIGNTIQKNSIFANGGLGIDLGYDGVTIPDSHTAGEPGPNNWQNSPLLTAAYPGPSASPVVTGRLHGAAHTSFTLDFYASPTPGPSLGGLVYGPGQRWLGSTTVVTDDSGIASLPATAITLSPTSLGEWISATATAPDGSTSEFSQDVQVLKAVTTTTVTASVNPS